MSSMSFVLAGGMLAIAMLLAVVASTIFSQRRDNPFPRSEDRTISCPRDLNAQVVVADYWRSDERLCGCEQNQMRRVSTRTDWKSSACARANVARSCYARCEQLGV